MVSEAELYRRGAETAVACWEEIAHGCDGASVRRLRGVAAAVFPSGPERGVYNNAMLDRGLPRSDRAGAVDAMEAAYSSAGITRFAAWTHESDVPMRQELERRGYRLEETTRAMGMSLDEIRLPRPDIELAAQDWLEYLRILDVPPGLLTRVDPDAFHVLIARLDDANAATGMAFDRDGDCGIYNVTTLAAARRRGLGTGLTAVLVHDAAARGCRTATLQSTQMAEHVYAAVGFRDLGRILEYVPAA